MLFELLNNRKRQLRISAPKGNPGNAVINSFSQHVGDNDVMCYMGQGDQQAYFLPWQEDHGLYVKLPLMNPSSNLFMTAMLTGCSVGVKLNPDCVQIFHYNDGERKSNPLLNTDSYRAYGDDTVWLVPEDLSFKDQIPGRHIYTPQTAVFGEYDGGRWTIYYQEAKNCVVQILFQQP